LAVPDIVGQDEEVLRDVERRARAEQHIGKHRIQQGVRASASPMQQQHRVIHVTCGVAVQRAQGEVMQPELGQRLVGAESEVRQHNGPVDCWPLACGWRRRRCWWVRRRHRHGLSAGSNWNQQRSGEKNPGCAKLHAFTPGSTV
jgi:hypothetical protein